ncbi:MAG: hypothetical protein ACR2KJ_04395 [Jatrophihabitans sp.]
MSESTPASSEWQEQPHGSPPPTDLPPFVSPWDPFTDSPNAAAAGAGPTGEQQRTDDTTTQRDDLQLPEPDSWSQPNYQQAPPTPQQGYPAVDAPPPGDRYPAGQQANSYVGDPYPAAAPPNYQPAPPEEAPAPEPYYQHRGVDEPISNDPNYLGASPPPPHRAPATVQRPQAPAQLPRPDQSLRPESLLAPNRPDMGQKPASWGWRGRMNRVTGGLLKPKPTSDELADRQARIDVQRAFSKPMTVVVIQPKGGAGKTPTTIGLASALGVHRGGYVLGWDDNETRGTLAVRVKNLYGQGTTAWDLLGALPRFERADARVGDLAQFVRAQGEAQFDALASDDNPANMAQIGEQEFSRLHEVLQRFYRVIVIDTGNNVRSPNWQAAVNAADLVVVVSTYQRDVGYSASWVLDHLGQTGRGVLANGAVTVLTAADPKPDPTVRKELMSHFGTRTRSVVEVPYDPHIAVGGPMEWSLMREDTRRAWTRAGAAVVDALGAAEGSIP